MNNYVIYRMQFSINLRHLGINYFQLKNNLKHFYDYDKIFVKLTVNLTSNYYKKTSFFLITVITTYEEPCITFSSF